jgi:hypothetical protein
MKNETLLALNIGFRLFASVVSLCGATFLAWHGKEGWGWLIFAAIILGSVTVRYNEKTSTEDDG